MNRTTKKRKNGQHLRIYLTHAAVDMIAARKLRNLLSAHLDAQVFMSENLSAAEEWQSKLRSALAESDVILAFLTPHSVGSNWVLHELGAAWALEKPILPIVTDRWVLNSLPINLSDSEVVEMKDPQDPGAAERIVKQLERLLAHAAA